MILSAVRFLGHGFCAAAIGLLLSLWQPGSANAQPSTTQGTLVRVASPYGPIDIALDDAGAPRTVANFLQYTRQGLYDTSFFHRLAKGFVLQGGAFRISNAGSLSAVPAFAPVVNEFSPTRSNLRGTVAMAKVAGDPNSATNSWFINLANNSANLDVQNGGFTVFGRVLAPSMTIADSIARGSVVNASTCTNLGNLAPAFGELPVVGQVTGCQSLSAATLVRSTAVRELAPRATAPVADRVFEFLEAMYPAIVAPASPVSIQSGNLTYRYYARTNTYLGVSGDRLYGYAPVVSEQIIDLGSFPEWLQQAAQAGY